MGNTHVDYFKFRPVVKEGMLLQDFLFLALAAFFFLWNRTACTILVEGIMRNIPVKLF